jgi:hypothetical protein
LLRFVNNNLELLGPLRQSEWRFLLLLFFGWRFLILFALVIWILWLWILSDGVVLQEAKNLTSSDVARHLGGERLG